MLPLRQAEASFFALCLGRMPKKAYLCNTNGPNGRHRGPTSLVGDAYTPNTLYQKEEMNSLSNQRTHTPTAMHRGLKRIGLGLMLMLWATLTQAQIPTGYYNSINNQTGQELRQALHNIIKGHKVVSYSGLLDAYAYTDCDANNKIWDIYSNKRWSLSANCGNYDSEGDCWNREHTWPSSWFNDKSGPKSDLFHVMPTDGYVNNRRSNYPYGEVNKATYTSANGSKLGACSTDGYSGTVFEPVDEYKGDVARNFFYMSTRYYSEDSGWGSSGMTSKSDIKPWAIAMLLRWHKADPVSQKEIDRNNAVFGYQGNRNPFIDHPEYAERIWDENWQAGTSYAITAATNLNGGTVSAPNMAEEGSTVAISATPAVGYAVTGYSAWRTGSTGTTVSVSTNGTFTMPAYAVTVSASFERDNTQYAISTAATSHGTVSASTPTALAGTTVDLTIVPDDGYQLSALYVYKTGDMNITVPVGTDHRFTMPAYNVTVSATFAEQSTATGQFVKVTAAPADWSGEYLIVYEGGNVAFDGGRSKLDAAHNAIGVAISDNTIEATDATNAATFTIAQMSGGYSIQAKNGKYIYQTSDSNGLTESDAPVANTLAFANGNVDIVCNNKPHLRFNKASDQMRFRYYKSASYTEQQAIQLYKRKEASAPVAQHTITFHNNDGQSATQLVDEFVATPLDANTFVREGFVFDGWTDSTGKYYADGATVTLLADLDLYALWDELFAISLTPSAGGTISASHTAATEETTIQLTATPANGYQLFYWTVTDADGQHITVYDNTFSMPAYSVAISAVFVEVGQTTSGDATYEKVTSEPTDWSGEYLIVNETAKVAFNGALTSLDQIGNTISVSIADGKIASSAEVDAATFSIEKAGQAYAIKSKSGFYIGRTASSNGFNQDATTAYTHTLTLSGGDVSITSSGGPKLQYYSQKNQERFRYYASKQQTVQLYKKVAASAPVVILADDDTPLPDGEKNIDAIAGHEGSDVDVILYGRTLYKDGTWNTLCLPFGLSTLDDTPLEGATVKALASASVEGTTLHLNFEQASAIEAGQPYIVKWGAGTNLTHPRFDHVGFDAAAPSAFATDQVQFVGTYTPTPLTKNDRSLLYFGADSHLYYPATDNFTIGAFRAFFRLSEEAAANIKQFVVNIDGTPTGINTISTDNDDAPGTWFGIDGRRLQHRPAKPGVYMNNGRKVVVK